MRLTRYTDYGLRVLLYLGAEEDRLASISEIAEAFGISHNHLMKVAHQLVQNGYLASTRGRAGGLRLARPPAAINLGEVIRRLEDDFALVDCSTCRIASTCGLREALGAALAAFLAVLDRYTLADILVMRPGPAALFGLGSDSPGTNEENLAGEAGCAARQAFEAPDSSS